MNIGILSLFFLGDSIVLSPFLRQIRKNFPKSKITLFIGGSNVSKTYYSRINTIDEIVVLNRKQTSLLQKMKIIISNFRKFDLMIDNIQGRKMSNLICRIFGKKSIGFEKAGNYSITIGKNTVNLNDFIIKQQYLILKKLIGYECDDYSLDFPLYNKDFISLNKKVCVSSNEFVVFHPSSKKNNLSRKLGINQIEKIIDILEENGLKICLIGSKDDMDIMSKIKDRRGVIQAYKSNLTIWETGVLISKSLFYIGINSGPIWISIALKKPSIIINGPTSQCRIPPTSCYNFVNNFNTYSPICTSRMCDMDRCKYNPLGNGLCIQNLDIDLLRTKIIQLTKKLS